MFRVHLKRPYIVNLRELSFLMQKSKLYVIIQLVGWFSYVFFSGVLNHLNGTALDWKLIITMFLAFLVGIVTSHFYRNVIIRLGWTQYNIVKLIPRVLISSAILGVVFMLLFYPLFTFITNDRFIWDWPDIFQRGVNFAMVFLFWSLIYFTYHFFERYRAEEIKNLRWEATKNEIELNKLKSQLNPHFIFNSMNTIKALVDEDPKKAKKSITQLSNILRITLMMETRKTVSFEEEMRIVSDYIAIEKARYEERLSFQTDIAPGSERYQVPSMMLQTLVENGIKHGISRLPGGGIIFLKTWIEEELLHIKIENTGQLNKNAKPETGFGLVNTKQRLHLLYDDEASFRIENKNESTVVSELVLPFEPN